MATDPVHDIKKLIGSPNLVIGTKRTLRELKQGRLKRVFLSMNCPERVRKDIAYYQKLSPVDIVVLQHPNTELGNVCKKPFAVSVLSVRQ
ncbi:ribosomal L7Ae/L30e/S12e/Gadd45 family protein [Candidatus Woesearchaeota archaeon]|nr:ribosomal L7Ae/L30e/S12e/Gadd45 family protein [Candidatus Woesearchaeota archaeon]